MRSKSNMKNIILILTLNIVFLSSMWNCNDKFDEMCVKYPQLLLNLFKPQFNENEITTTKIIPNDDVINDIKKGLWALFEITLIEDIATKIDTDKKGNLLEGIVNEKFLILNLHYSFYFSLFREGDIHNDKVYLFVSDINTYGVVEEGTSLFKECNNIKEIKVICSGSSNKKKKDSIVYLFNKCGNLEKVNLENLNLNWLYVEGLFYGCNKLGEIRLQKSNGDKNNLNLYNLLWGVVCDKSKSERTIKLYCTEHFLSKINTMCTKVLWRDDNGQEKLIFNDLYKNEDYKKELQDSDCYRKFILTFNVEEKKEDA